MKREKLRLPRPDKTDFNAAVIGSIVIFLTFLLSGCGLETVAFLEPPAAASIQEPLTGEKRFRFGNWTGIAGTDPATGETQYEYNDENTMLGYEIYYKFYSTTQLNTLNSEVSQVTLDPRRQKIIDLGYLRLYAREEAPIPVPEPEPRLDPLVNLNIAEPTNPVYTTINFGSLDTDPYPPIEFVDKLGNPYPITSLNAARFVRNLDPNVNDVVPVLYGFSMQELTVDYEDFSQSLVDPTTYEVEVYVSLYVVSFGVEDIFNPIYSEPAHLGRVLIDIDEVQQ